MKQNFSYVSDVSLKVFQAKAAHDKPEFEGTEAPAEGNLPVLNHRKQYCYNRGILQSLN